VVRLTIPALHSFRDLVLSAVSAAIDAAGGSPSTDVRDEIVSALSEAFNNVVIHAYRGVRGGTVDVRIDATGPARAGSADAPGDASVEVCLLDRGRPFEPLDVPRFVSPTLDAPSDLDDLDVAQIVADLPESGMGLFIMRSFMDDVSYQPGGGGKPNALTLRKSWRRVVDAEAERRDCVPQRTPERRDCVPQRTPERRDCVPQRTPQRRDCVPQRMPSGPSTGMESSAKSSSEKDPEGAVSREQNASFAGGPSSKKESSRSGWRMRSVAVPSYEQSTVGSLKRK